MAERKKIYQTGFQPKARMKDLKHWVLKKMFRRNKKKKIWIVRSALNSWASYQIPPSHNSQWFSHCWVERWPVSNFPNPKTLALYENETHFRSINWSGQPLLKCGPAWESGIRGRLLGQLGESSSRLGPQLLWRISINPDRPQVKMPDGSRRSLPWMLKAGSAVMLFMSKITPRIQHGGAKANSLSLAAFTFRDSLDMWETSFYLLLSSLPIIAAAAARLWIAKKKRWGGNYPSGRIPPPSLPHSTDLKMKYTMTDKF